MKKLLNYASRKCVVAALGFALIANVLPAHAQQTNETYPGNKPQVLDAIIVSGAGPANYRLNAAIGKVRVNVERSLIPADGQTRTAIQVELFDKEGKPFEGKAIITVENSGGRLLLPGAKTDELGSEARDADRTTSGTQIMVQEGKTQFDLLAPSTPQDVRLRITAGEAVAEGTIVFVPELRDWIAAGLIEGVIALRKTSNESTLTPLRSNDGFEEQLKQWSRNFNESSASKGSAAARAAFFIKGKISGEALLTATYDSDKETRLRMLRDIRPDELYPVYGDASLKSNEAKSASKLFVRVDQGRHYALFGDFSTSDGFSQLSGGGSVASIKQRDLGNYSRSLTGARGHWQTENSVANAFAVRDSLRQQVEEYAGNGTSGPYSISRNDAIEGTEKVELIIRDRNNPGRVLEQRPLQRLVDYSFDPFSGRLLFKGPIQSTDAQGNPQSIRITYELNQQSVDYWVAGVDAQTKLTPWFEIGGSYVQDRNPLQITTPNERQLSRLTSANIGVQLGENARLVAEAARTLNDTSLGEQTGSAGRVEVIAEGAQKAWTLSAFVAKAQENFYNPSASLNSGRGEAAIKGAVKATDALTLKAEVNKSTDVTTSADRKGGLLGAEVRFSEAVIGTIAVRKSQDNGSGLYSPTQTGGVNNLYSGSGLMPSSGGLFGNGTGPANPALGQVPQLGTQSGAALDTTTVQLGLRAKITDMITLGAEGEKNVSGDKAHRAALTAQYQLAERTAINARLETQTGLGSYTDRAKPSNAFVVGITNNYMLQGLGAGGSGVEGQLFSEYRLRDAENGREAQFANGLRNTFDVAEGLKAVIGVERLQILSGTGQKATAVATGLDYTGSELWKATGRLEWRRADENAISPRTDSWLNIVSLARKLDRDWTLLVRNYYSSTDNGAIAGKQWQDRAQLGFAYRPVDHNRFDALGKLELKRERNDETNAALLTPESRRVLIGSVLTNWHPSRPLWLTGRVAFKRLNENLEGVPDQFNAYLLGGRAIYDFAERWDVGVMLSTLNSATASQRAAGAELGYALQTNLWLSVGYNWAGFTDRDLTGSEYTARGPYLRLRFKFDEDLFRREDKAVNPTSPR
jgi:hypothetical protein